MSRSRKKPYSPPCVLSKRGQSYWRRRHNQTLRRKKKLMEHELMTLKDIEDTPVELRKYEGLDIYDLKGLHYERNFDSLTDKEKRRITVK